MKILRIGNDYQFYDDSLRTYDKLPVGTYTLNYNEKNGCFLSVRQDIHVGEKVYGNQEIKTGKVMRAFSESGRSLGVILSGDKGIGKSLFAKRLCEEAITKSLPVIVVEFFTRDLPSFIGNIEQECLVLFDEFDKTFRKSGDVDSQAKMLTLFDGISGGKKLYVITCNELHSLSDYIVNRPGRFHYHFRFEYPTTEDIQQYLSDNLKPEYHGEIDDVVAFSKKITLNYDCLRSVAFELNMGEKFSDAITDLNILNTDEESYNLELVFENGEKLHHWRYRTNLFNHYRDSCFVTMYNVAERSVVDLTFNKMNVIFDKDRFTIKIPGEFLELDFEDYTEVVESGAYKKLKPLYLTFVRAQAANLHYLV